MRSEKWFDAWFTASLSLWSNTWGCAFSNFRRKTKPFMAFRAPHPPEDCRASTGERINALWAFRFAGLQLIRHSHAYAFPEKGDESPHSRCRGGMRWFGLVEGAAVAAGLFGFVEGFVGILEDAVAGILAIGECNAHA